MVVFLQKNAFHIVGLGIGQSFGMLECSDKQFGARLDVKPNPECKEWERRAREYGIRSRIFYV